MMADALVLLFIIAKFVDTTTHGLCCLVTVRAANMHLMKRDAASIPVETACSVTSVSYETDTAPLSMCCGVDLTKNRQAWRPVGARGLRSSGKRMLWSELHQILWCGLATTKSKNWQLRFYAGRTEQYFGIPVWLWRRIGRQTLLLEEVVRLPEKY